MIKIKPQDIDAETHFFDAFGNVETEISARWIVQLCQERGNWDAFTYTEIEEFYFRKGGFAGFSFNRLTGGTYRHMTAKSFPYGEERTAQAVIVKVDDLYHITSAFVEACYQSSPVNKEI